ncbi:MAG: DUF86 domain-containing protein [Acidobacteria bacterium]|nr:MAG: DUF86 domain-containing protein [Acidobacteriota bacterium]REK11072.1 MAG: DUF86 domain-containing protein [Acidobacteriota bacterium]
MTFLVERLGELRRYLAHLEGLRDRVSDAGSLRADLSLHNDVLFSLLSICQLVIDIAGELSSRSELSFTTYAESVRNLEQLDPFDAALVSSLVRLVGFRNVLLHEYVSFDLERAVAALHDLEPVHQFVAAVGQIEDAAG